MSLKRFLAALLLSLVGLVLLAGMDLYNFTRRPGPDRETIIEIAPGSPLKKIARQLRQKGVISSVPWFIIVNRLNGSGTSLKAGEYRIAPRATPLEIIELLKSGRVIERSLSIPEGFTLKQIGERLVARGICRGDEFERLSRNRQLLEKWEIPGSSLEGYLFPSTYNYSRQTGCRQMLETMLATGKREYEKIRENSPPLNLTRHQVLTLASMIQKEAGTESEMPLIASVFFNRLRRDMRLASDPTTIYALGPAFDGNLRRRDLKNPSPYNTYQHKGLPPGPICSAGRKAIAAVFNPADSDFLYFVARGDGRHQFSRSLKEHNRAVYRYQLHRSKK